MAENLEENTQSMQENANKIIEAHKYTQEQLFIEASRDEQLKIAELPWDSDPQLAMQKLVARFKQLENISLEAKVRATEAAKKMRQVENASGKNRWDKERRGENSSNNSNPLTNSLLSAAQKQHKKDLSKVEKLVSGMIELGYTDNDILDGIPESKFKGSEVRAAIQKIRE